jgi:hypothetical protein
MLTCPRRRPTEEDGEEEEVCAAALAESASFPSAPSLLSACLSSPAFPSAFLSLLLPAEKEEKVPAARGPDVENGTPAKFRRTTHVLSGSSCAAASAWRFETAAGEDPRRALMADTAANLDAGENKDEAADEGEFPAPEEECEDGEGTGPAAAAADEEEGEYREESVPRAAPAAIPPADGSKK